MNTDVQKNQLHYSQVVADFELKIEATRETLLNLDWSNPEVYAEWLAQTYFFVKHTIGFMGLQVTKFNMSSDSFLAGILEHFREEQGHDTLLLNDLKRLKKNISQFHEYPETRAFYQTQYFWIDYRDANAHLGYSLFLEGLAAKACPELFEILTNKYGTNCASFIQVHSEADQDHFAEGCVDMKNLPEQTLQWVSENLAQSFALYVTILNKIKNKYAIKRTSSERVA